LLSTHRRERSVTAARRALAVVTPAFVALANPRDLLICGLPLGCVFAAVTPNVEVRH
jgi:hypothetical protein